MASSSSTSLTLLLALSLVGLRMLFWQQLALTLVCVVGQLATLAAIEDARGGAANVARVCIAVLVAASALLALSYATERRARQRYVSHRMVRSETKHLRTQLQKVSAPPPPPQARSPSRTRFSPHARSPRRPGPRPAPV